MAKLRHGNSIRASLDDTSVCGAPVVFISVLSVCVFLFNPLQTFLVGIYGTVISAWFGVLQSWYQSVVLNTMSLVSFFWSLRQQTSIIGLRATCDLCEAEPQTNVRQ
ncbi:hypothetical protein OROGR_009044 [Orobanche gracilis]